MRLLRRLDLLLLALFRVAEVLEQHLTRDRTRELVSVTDFLDQDRNRNLGMIERRKADEDRIVSAAAGLCRSCLCRDIQSGNGDVWRRSAVLDDAPHATDDSVQVLLLQSKFAPLLRRQ